MAGNLGWCETGRKVQASTDAVCAQDSETAFTPASPKPEPAGIFVYALLGRTYNDTLVDDEGTSSLTEYDAHGCNVCNGQESCSTGKSRRHGVRGEETGRRRTFDGGRMVQ